MKQKLKHLIIGVLIGLLISSNIVFANSVKQFILQLASYPIVIDGQEYVNNELPILNYQGNTYVPLKAMGNILDANIEWNDALKRIEIGANNNNNNIVNQELQKDSDNKQENVFDVIKANVFFKVNDKLYTSNMLSSYRKDQNNNFYLSSFTSLVEFLAIPSGLYIVEKNANPFTYGSIQIERSKYSNFLEYENIFTDINNNYFEFTYRNNKGETYFVSTEPGNEKGLVIDKNNHDQPLIPLYQFFDKLKLNYTIEYNENDNTLIFNLN